MSDKGNPYVHTGSSAPYYDDFDADKNYMRIMYRPGMAVQARELTQSQTILQNQLSALAGKSYKNGQPLSGARISISYTQQYMNIDPSSLVVSEVANVNERVKITLNSLIGRVFYSSEGTQNKIIVTDVDGTYENEVLVSARVMFSYLGGEIWNASGAYDTHFITDEEPNCSFRVINIENKPTVGTVAVATNAKGTIFYNGYILSVPQQTCVIDYDTEVNSSGQISEVDLNQIYNIGYVIKQLYANTTDDDSLYDNAQGSTNYSAPGADRLSFEVVLTSYRGDTNIVAVDDETTFSLTENDTIPEHFIRGITVENKKIIFDHLEYDNISEEIMDVLAKRTYDESGSYTVNPWYVNISDNGPSYDVNHNIIVDEETNQPILDNEAYFTATVKPGSGYIKGYNVTTKVSTPLYIEKARTSRTNSTTYSYLSAPSGLYTYADFDTSTNTLYSTDIPSINTMPYALVVSASWSSTNTAVKPKYVLGVVRVINMYREGNKLRIYLGETSKVINKFASAKYLVFGNGLTSSSNSLSEITGYLGIYKNITNKAEIYGQEIPDLVELNNVMTKGVSKVKYVATMWASATCNTAGEITLSQLSAGLSFTGTILFAYRDDTGTSGKYVNLNNISIDGTGGNLLKLISSDFTQGSKYNVLCSINVTYDDNESATRNKSLVSNIITFTGKASTLANVKSLEQEDIFDIVSVYQTTNLADGMTDTTDLKDKLILDNGQRDHYYDVGSLSGFSALASNVADVDADVSFSITFRYFKHDSGTYVKAPFSASSYPQTVYSKISSYRASNNKVYSLRNCLDFRVKKSELSSESHTSGLPYPNSKVGFIDSVYLPRIDAIWVDSNGEFGVTKGIPSLEPEAPAVKSNSLRIYNLNIPAYTLDVETIKKIYVDNQRYTMNDISKLESRIENLETQMSLTQLELDTLNKDVTDANGLTRFKTGIFTDDFSSFDYCDYTNEEWDATIDGMEQSLRPQFTTDAIDFVYAPNQSTSVKKTSDAVILPYSTTIYASNLAVSKTVNVQQLMFATWNGALKLTPSIDNWVTNLGNKITNKYVDTAQPPTVYKLWSTNSRVIASNTDYYINHVKGQDWGFGNRIGKRVTTSTIATTKTYMVTSYTSSWVMSGSTSVAKQSADKYMRRQTVSYSASGFRPGVKVRATMDGKALSLSNNTVNANGDIEGTFVVPANMTCGTKCVEFKDIYGTSEAKADYTGTGVTIWNEVTNTYLRTWTQNTSFTSSTTNSTTTNVSAWDPIAQTFFVKESNGIFIDSIDVFVASKDANAPLTLYVCECENGIPTSRILPFGQVQKKSSEITCCTYTKTKDTVSAVTSFKPTNFKFSTPLYLEGNTEYAFVLITNSYKYEVFVSEVGAYDARLKKAIVEQPYTGSLLMSQNTRTWTPEQSMDLTFRIHKCVFPTTGTHEAVFNINTTSRSKKFVINSMCLCTELFTPSGTEALTYAQFGRTNPNKYTSKYIEYENKLDIDFDDACTIYTGDSSGSVTPSLRIKVVMNTTNANITPMIDLEQIYGIFSHNDVTRTSDVDYPYRTGTYISTTTKLEEESSTFRVILDAIKPRIAENKGSDIDVFYQTSAYNPIYIEQAEAVETDTASFDSYGTDVDKARELIDKTVRVFYITETKNGMTVSKKNSAGEYVSENASKFTLSPKELATITSVSSNKETSMFNTKATSVSSYRVYLGSVANTDDFKNAYDIHAAPNEGNSSSYVNSSASSICLMDLNVEEEISVETWNPAKNQGTSSTSDAVAYPVNSVVYYNGFFWINKKSISVGECASMVPSTYSSNWEKIVGIKCATEVQQEPEEVNWRPMELVADAPDNIKSEQFVEYEYIPADAIDAPFTSFAIKIVFKANDSCNVARVRNVRAIATV